MSLEQDGKYHERLRYALDCLLDDSALQASCLLATSAALKFIKEVLQRVSTGTDPSQPIVAPQKVKYPKGNQALYIWFTKLQKDFTDNIAFRLLDFVRRLRGAGQPGSPGAADTLQVQGWIIETMFLLQGCLLLHVPSKELLNRQPQMKLILHFLEPSYPEIVQVCATQTIITALVDHARNLRVFEDVGGLEVVSRIFLSPTSSHGIKVKLLEFLYFYLMPEGSAAFRKSGSQNDGDTIKPTTGKTRAGDTFDSNASTIKVRQHQREPGIYERSSSEALEPTMVERTTEQKQVLLGRYFSNIDALVKDLHEFKPFGDW